MFIIDGAAELEYFLKDEVTRYYNERETLPKHIVEAGLREANRVYAGGFTDGNLLPTFDIVRYGRGDYALEASGEDLLFLEYGYGIVGASAPYPEPINWTYDKNNHGNKGWLYPPKNGDKRLLWSRGIRGRMGMYKASQKMHDALFKYLNKW